MAVASDGTVYWTNHGQIGSVAYRSLSDPADTVHVLASSQDYPWAIAVDDQTVYWTHGVENTSDYTRNALRYASRDGGIAADFANNAVGFGVVVARGYVFWGNGEGSNALVAQSTAGGPVLTFPTESNPRVMGTSANGDKVYVVTQYGSVHRLLVPASGMPTQWQKLYSEDVGANLSPQIAIADDMIIWATTELICLPLNGDTPHKLLDGKDAGPGVHAGTPFGLWYDSDQHSLYFTTTQSYPKASWLYRMRLYSQCRPGEVELIHSGVDIRGIAQHQGMLYWAVHSADGQQSNGQVMAVRPPVPSSSSSSSTSSSSGADCSGANLDTNARHCGVCNHDCGPGACVAGKCQPFVWHAGTRPHLMTVTEDGFIYWTNNQLGGSVVGRSLSTTEPTLQVVAYPVEYAWAVATRGDYVFWTHGKENPADHGVAPLRYASRTSGEALDFGVQARTEGVVMARDYVFWLSRDSGPGGLSGQPVAGGSTVSFSTEHPPYVIAASPSGDAVYVVDMYDYVYRLRVPEQGAPSTFDTLYMDTDYNNSPYTSSAGDHAFTWNVRGNRVFCLSELAGGPYEVQPGGLTVQECTFGCFVTGMALDEQGGALYLNIGDRAGALLRIPVDSLCQAGTPEVLATTRYGSGVVQHGNFVYWAESSNGEEHPRGRIMAVRKP